MSDGPSGSEPLTPREQEILRLAREGLSNNEIAQRLGLKHNALRFHLKHLHAKLLTDGQRTALAGNTGRRWGWLPLAFTGWLAPVGAAAAVVAVSIGGYVAVRAANESHSGNSTASSPTPMETMTLPAFEPTLAEIADQCHLDLATLEQLNRGIKEPISFGQSVIVPVNQHCQAGSAAITPPATPAAGIGKLIGTPTSISALGGNAALFGPFPDTTDAPSMTANIHAISPSHMGMVQQADTRTADRLNPHGVCAEVAFDEAAPNIQWFRMAVDDAEVTHDLTVAVNPDNAAARLCYAPKDGLAPGSHFVSVVVVRPGSDGPPSQRVVWTFHVVPAIGG